MNDFQLSTTHDLVIQQGDLLLHETQQDVAKQALKVSLLTYRGEWRYDTKRGVPYLQQIMKVGTSKTFADSIIKNAASQSYNVVRVNSISSALGSGRTYKVNDLSVTVQGGDIVTLNDLEV